MAEGGAIMLVWDHWHIEPSSICALKCPRCPRTEVPETLLNRQLDLKFFQDQIGEKTIKSIHKITLCGNDGDPIYCRELLEIIQWIKSINPSLNLVIITNGSYRPRSWWHQLAETLNHHDEINWSIDGWDPESNRLYRVNSDWDSIIDGISTFKTINRSTYCVWATIAFRFNQDHLFYMQSLAVEHGMDLFQLTKSTKFGNRYPETYGIEDPLCPTRKELIASGHRFERTLHHITSRERPSERLKPIFWQRAQELKKQSKYSGICLIGNKGVFLNSQGEFYPCCWTANRYNHNKSWHDLGSTKFNLRQKNFQDIINDEFWTGEFLKFDSLECTTKCTSSQLNDQYHVTEW